MASIGMGVDPGVHSVKILQGRNKGDRFQLTCVAEVPSARSPEDGRLLGSVEDLVREAIDEPGLRRAPTVVGVTGRDLMIRYTQLPPLPAHRLGVLMEFEIREIAEKIEGEVAADYNLLPGEIGDGGERLAILAMAKESFLEARVAACTDARLPVLHATPNALAVFNAFLKFGQFREGETTLLLDIGEENADLAIQRDGDLLFARNLSFGGRNFTDALMGHFGVNFKRAEELKRGKGTIAARGETRFEDGLSEKVARALSGVVGPLVGLIQSSLSFCKVQWKRTDLKADRVVLSGGGSLLSGIARSLSDNLGVPVEPFDPGDRLDLSELPEEEAERVLEAPQRYAVALGLAQMALDSRFFRVEILPDALRRKREFRERHLFLAGAAALGVVYLGVAGILGSRNLRAAEARNEKVSGMESDRKRDETTYEDLLEANRTKIDRLGQLHDVVLPGFALANTIDAVQRNLEGMEGLWIQAVELKDVRARTKGAPERPVVVVEGAGVEVDEDVGSACDRFAAALKKDLLERWAAKAAHSFNRRTNTFVIQVEFEPEETVETDEEGQ